MAQALTSTLSSDSRQRFDAACLELLGRGLARSDFNLKLASMGKAISRHVEYTQVRLGHINTGYAAGAIRYEVHIHQERHLVEQESEP